MDVTMASPQEIDRRIADLNREQAGLRERIARLLRAAHRLVGDTTDDRGLWIMRNVNVMDVLRDREDPEAVAVTGGIDGAERELARAVNREVTLDDEYLRRGRWPRWYLVDRGHLHSDASASRCSRTPRTDHYWLVEFSGRPAEEMITVAGDRVCTVCFPSAPVNPGPARGRFMTPGEAERAAYAEQARRDRAAKVAAQITTPGGGPLMDGRDLVRTEKAAWNRAMAAAYNLALYRVDHPEAPQWRRTVAVCVDALAARRGVTAQSLRAELNTKIAKKAEKDGFKVRSTV